MGGNALRVRLWAAGSWRIPAKRTVRLRSRRMPQPSDYPHVLPIVTRWKDNDVYGHVNNVEYYSYFDTVINAWLIREGGLDIHGGEVIGACAESHCTYAAGLAFPETVE